MHKIAAGVVVAALALAACGGSSKSNSSSGGSSSTTVSGGGNSSTTASGGGSDGFSQLVAKAKTADFKVTYTTSDGKSETIEQDGKGKTAFVTDGSVMISDGTKTISCSGTTASATCTDLGTSGAGALSGLTAIFTTAYAGLAGLNSSAYNGHTSSQTIAGRDATCVTIKASDYAGFAGLAGGKLGSDASLTTCVDKSSGYLLKLAGTDASGTEQQVLLATAAGSSSASDFVPPSTPVTIPGIPTP